LAHSPDLVACHRSKELRFQKQHYDKARKFDLRNNGQACQSIDNGWDRNAQQLAVVETCIAVVWVVSSVTLRWF
jgi:hypothetical protein